MLYGLPDTYILQNIIHHGVWCMVGFWHWHIPTFIIADIFPPLWDFVMVGICWVTMTNIIIMMTLDQHTHGLPCWRTPKTSSWSSRACAQGGIQGAAARTAWTTNSTMNTNWQELTYKWNCYEYVSGCYLDPDNKNGDGNCNKSRCVGHSIGGALHLLCYYIIMLLYYYYHSITRTLHLW